MSGELGREAAGQLRAVCLVPTAADAAVCVRVLREAGLEVDACTGPAELDKTLRPPVDLVLAAEETLEGRAGISLQGLLADQEDWSAIPLILLIKKAGRAGLRALHGSAPHGGLVLLERPVRLATLVSTVELALQGRRQQYRVRNLLAERAQRLRERDEFIALLGHELRNPFAAISLCAELLEKDPADSGQTEECRRVILRQAEQVKRLLDDLLAVSCMTRGKLQLKPEPADLRAIIRTVMQQLERPLSEARQTLSVSLPSTRVPVFADPIRLQQVFANLLHNASRYSPPEAPIELKVSVGAGSVEVRVRDHGIGIASDDIQRIFEPFFQAGAGNRKGGTERGGLGLGLALARSLIEGHGGGIAARSEGLGRGSEFSVTVPLSEGAASGVSSQPPAPPSEGKNRPQRVLLVDDNQEVTFSLERLLSRRGYEVQVANTGLDCIKAAERRTPDVVLLDVGLPDLDGYEVARRLRAMPALAATRVIALTGYGGEKDRQQSREAGIDKHLVKPVGLRAVEAAIKETERTYGE
jgi:signal transduction histidine kinase/ActR/RegA family two-component response regulator